MCSPHSPSKDIWNHSHCADKSVESQILYQLVLLINYGFIQVKYISASSSYKTAVARQVPATGTSLFLSNHM